MAFLYSRPPTRISLLNDLAKQAGSIAVRSRIAEVIACPIFQHKSSDADSRKASARLARNCRSAFAATRKSYLAVGEPPSNSRLVGQARSPFASNLGHHA